jgi:hypothetical protein
MADVQTTTRETHPASSDGARDTIGSVNVYDANTTPPVSSSERTTYTTDPAPVTRSSPGVMTWLLILIAVVLALYFVVQILT